MTDPEACLDATALFTSQMRIISKELLLGYRKFTMEWQQVNGHISSSKHYVLASPFQASFHTKKQQYDVELSGIREPLNRISGRH
jgi:hypothetical protein